MTGVRLAHACTMHNQSGTSSSGDIASFPVPCPAFRRLQYDKAVRAWYIPHVSDVKGRKTVKDLNELGRTWVSEQQEERRYQVTYHTYLASGGQLSYSPSIERVDVDGTHKS